MKDALLARLADGEQLVWSGQPDPRRTGAAYIVHALFGLPFAALPLLGAVRGDTPFLVSIPFVACGMLMTFLPLIMGRLAARTVLAITTTRVVVLRQRTGGRHALRWVNFQDIAALETHHRPDGSGILSIRHRNPNENDYESGYWDSMIGIPDVRGAEAAIRGRLSGVGR